MGTSRVLVIQTFVVLFALGLIGVWVHSAKGGNVTNCRGARVKCIIYYGAPAPCDDDCSGIWPIQWCDDKTLDNDNGYCYDAGHYTGANCYETIFPDHKRKKRRCDCQDGNCFWFRNPDSPDGYFWSGDLVCPGPLVLTSC